MPALGTDMMPTADKTNASRAKGDGLRSPSAGAIRLSIRRRPDLRSRHGRINVKLILIVVGVLVVLGVGLFVARNVRRKILAERDLAAGNAAYDREDWAEASKRFLEYLGRRPGDREILRKYAKSLLSTEPLDSRSIGRAIGTYRQLMRLAPDDAEACEELAKVYLYLGDFGELSYIADRRREQDPDDPKVTIWHARALLVDGTDKKKIDRAREILESLMKRLSNDDTGKHPEYIEACRLLSRIELATKGNPRKAHSKAMACLDQAVKYDPKSSSALIHRSILRRRGPPPVDANALKLSRDDLQQAQAIKTDDPRIALALSKEWMRYGKLDSANTCLQSVRDVDPAAVKKYFIRASDWTVIRFLQAAKLAVQRGKPAEAETEAEKALQTITDRRQRVVILPAVIRLYLVGKRNDEARKHLDELLELRKVLQVTRDEEQTVVLQATMALAENKFGEAIGHLGPMAMRDSPLASALDLLAKTYDRTGQRALAIRTAEKYLERQERYPEKYPDDPNMRLFLARQYAAAGSFSKAAQAAANAKSPAGDSIQAELLRIEMAIQIAAGRPVPDKASLDALAVKLNALQQTHSPDSRIRSLGALVELALGRPEAAEQRLRQAIKDSVKSPAMEFMLVRVLAGRGQMKDAMDAAEAICERYKHSRQAWTTLAGLHESSGNHSEARDALQRGLKAVEPGGRQGIARSLAVLELLHFDRKAGLKNLQHVAQQDPRDVISRSLLLSLPEVRAEIELSEKLLEEIRKVRGEGSRIWRRHRASLWLTGDRWRSNQDESIEALGKWMLQDPGTSFSALTLARLYLRLGKARQAEEVCRKALALNPYATEAAELLTRLLIQQRRHADVAEVLKALVTPSQQSDPLKFRAAIARGELETPIRELTLRAARNASDISARILLARLVYERDGDVKRAMAYLDEAAKIQPDSITIAWVQAAILKNDNKAHQARQLLDSLVKKTSSFGAYHIRARFLWETGESEAAEKDYIHLTTIEPRSEGYRLLASFYQNTNQLDRAVRTLNEGIKGDSKNAGIQFRLAHLLILRNGKDDLVRAEDLLSSLEKASGKTSYLLFTRALLAIAQQGPDSMKKAQVILEELVKLEPAHVRAYLALIQIAMARQDAAAVKAIAIRGLEANPNNPELLLSQARAERALKNNKAAADLARQVLKDRPGYTDAVGVVTSIAIRSKKSEMMSEALELARQASLANPPDYRLPLRAAEILRAMEKPADAVAELDRYTKTEAGKTSTPVLLALAAISRTAGQTDDWNRWMLQAENASPRHPAVMVERLRGLAVQNKHDEIVSQMTAYRQGKQVNASVLQTAAALLLSSESPAYRSEAVKLYERALAVNPESIPAQMNLALAANRTGDLDRAEAIYRKILKTQPRNAPALNDLAWTLATKRKDYKAALPLINKAVDVAPNSSHARDTRGMILSKLERFADARKDFEKCVELTAPDSTRRATALLQLGRTCSKLKDNTAAHKHMTEALRIDAENKVLTDEQRREIADILKNIPATSK